MEKEREGLPLAKTLITTYMMRMNKEKIRIIIIKKIVIEVRLPEVYKGTFEKLQKCYGPFLGVVSLFLGVVSLLHELTVTF